MKRCVFCGAEDMGFGNSTWPIFMDKDAESHRCCDKCNKEYVIAARRDRVLIMKIRHKTGVEYEGETLLKAGNYR